MTKALITIEVNFDVGRDRSSGLGVSSNPDYHGIRFIEQEKRDFIWDETAKWFQSKREFVQIKKVSLIREEKNEARNI